LSTLTTISNPRTTDSTKLRVRPRICASSRVGFHSPHAAPLPSGVTTRTCPLSRPRGPHPLPLSPSHAGRPGHRAPRIKRQAGCAQISISILVQQCAQLPQRLKISCSSRSRISCARPPTTLLLVCLFNGRGGERVSSMRLPAPPPPLPLLCSSVLVLLLLASCTPSADGRAAPFSLSASPVAERIRAGGAFSPAVPASPPVGRWME
jgi:hypothetical protein